MRYNRGFAKTNNCIPFTDRTIEISKYLADLRYEDIPAEVVERAKVILMHTVGAALAARGS
ncbi:MAG: MmgE/PrpD family protein, partial [Oscillospiraceae bacterium]|nr:MmgE/PrpD family protein [Oscillospiraceae bacterium]